MINKGDTEGKGKFSQAIKDCLIRCQEMQDKEEQRKNKVQNQINMMKNQESEVKYKYDPKEISPEVELQK